MLKGLLICNGSILSEKFTEIHDLYLGAAKKNNISLRLIKNMELFSSVSSTTADVLFEGETIRPDFVLFLDKDIVLARQLETMNIPVFNSSKVISECDDKILTFQKLANNNIRIPKTFFSHMQYKNTLEVNFKFIETIEEQLGYPMIIKEAKGSFGAQVYLINNRKELVQKSGELKYIPHLYQEFISTSKGKDVRIQVVGNKVVAAMKRVSQTDFRANISNGGNKEPFSITSDFEHMALKTAQILGADFVGVDILFGINNKPVLCEVNSNAHIKNISECTNIDVAGEILKYIVRKIEND